MDCAGRVWKAQTCRNFRKKHRPNYYLLVALEEFLSFLRDAERRAKLRMKVEHFQLEELVKSI